MSVQIPLWTIVTWTEVNDGDLLTGSDSSMDDCNVLDMDIPAEDRLVQIPLWTIVTVTTQRKICTL